MGRRVRAFGPGGPVLAAALFFFALGGPGPPGQASAPVEAETRRESEYGISAHVFFLGNMGNVGSMTIKSSQQSRDGRLEKMLRLAGGTSPEQARKKRDYGGEFISFESYPLRPDGSFDERALEDGRDVESFCSGFLKFNQKRQSERMTFFPDHVTVVLDDGPETRVEGSHGSILSPLEYLMEHDIQPGDVIDLPFLLKGVPRIFRMEVVDLEALPPFGAKAYEITLYAIDALEGPDRAPKDIWRKKGNLRIWFCKEGPYRNQMLRMRIKFRWYLWIRFDLKRAVTG